MYEEKMFPGEELTVCLILGALSDVKKENK